MLLSRIKPQTPVWRCSGRTKRSSSFFVYSQKMLPTPAGGVLLKPLTELDLKKVYRKAYNYRCISIRDKLTYIKCEACGYRFKDGRLKDSNILIKNIRILPELSSTQRRIVCLLGTVFEGEYPSINKIAETPNMNFVTVKRAIEALKEMQVIEKSLYI